MLCEPLKGSDELTFGGCHMAGVKAADRSPEDWVLTEDVASYVNRPVNTLHMWAHRHYGPPFVKMGRRRMYLWADVLAWVAAQPRGGDYQHVRRG
jgi:hypothetical protein